MTGPYLLGIDSGTTLVKSVVFDHEGREIAVARRETPLLASRPGWSELDMDAAWQATADTIAEVVATTGGEQIAAIGIAGTAGGIWPLDAGGRPTRAAILWNDGRAAEQIHRWQADGSYRRIFELSGNAPFPGYQLVTLRWLAEHEPETLARTRWLLFQKDWLRYCLTGEIHIEDSDVGYAPADARTRRYSAELLDLCGVAGYADRLPQQLRSDAVAGELAASVAARLGLRAGTPVVAGAVDVVASTLGGGACRVGQACSILGTSFLNSLVLAEPSFSPVESGAQTFLPNRAWLRSLVNTTGTLGLDWMLEQLAGPEREQAGQGKGTIFELVEATVREAPVGARGLIFLPYLNTAGMVSPFAEPSARGMFFGLSVEHRRADMLRAVYEGTALAMRDCYDTMGQPVDEVILVGGGARSAFWCQMFADATERRILTSEGSELGARGVALLAGLGVGVYASLEEAIRVSVRTARSYEPRPEAARVYRALYELYRQLCFNARESWRLRQRILDTLDAA
jgi:sugar (pentulose or hexulose) kinase